MARVFIGLGSNLGDRALEMQKACTACGNLPSTRIVRVSSIYETTPVGRTDQHKFLNAVIECDTALDPQELLKSLQGIEDRAGRTRTERWGPRVIDLDILLYGDTIVELYELTIPHPRMTERKFVLVPLAEIAPAVFHPVAHARVDELLARCTSAEEVTRYTISVLSC